VGKTPVSVLNIYGSAFNVPSGTFERRKILTRAHLACISAQYWPYLLRITGFAISAFVICITWPPDWTKFGSAVVAGLSWFYLAWLFSNRYRLRAIEVPDSLKKAGLTGASLTQAITSSARQLLHSVQMQGVTSPIELPPAPGDEALGTKVPVGQVLQLVWELFRRHPSVIEAQVIEPEERRYRVRFRLAKDGRSEETSLLSLEDVANAGHSCALTMIKLAAPFHRAWIAVDNNEINAAASIAHEAAKNGSGHDLRQRSLCWCFIALIRIARDDEIGSARALQSANECSPNSPMVAILSYELIANATSESPESETLRQEVRDWHRALGSVGRDHHSRLRNYFAYYAALSAQRRGRVVLLQELRGNVKDASQKLENALENPDYAFVHIHDVRYASHQAQRALERLMGERMPKENDRSQYLREYEGAVEDVKTLVERFSSQRTEIAHLEALAEEHDRMLKEEVKNVTPSDADRDLTSVFNQIETEIKKQQTEAKRFLAQVEETNQLFKKQFEGMTLAVEEAKARQEEWDRLEATPFGPNTERLR
jgi:flagellar biosynthesis chaperone FliJ